MYTHTIKNTAVGNSQLDNLYISAFTREFNNDGPDDLVDDQINRFLQPTETTTYTERRAVNRCNSIDYSASVMVAAFPNTSDGAPPCSAGTTYIFDFETPPPTHSPTSKPTMPPTSKPTRKVC